MPFHIADRVFRPSLLPTLTTLLLLPLLLGLGLWQWHRAEQKQIMQEAFQTRLAQPAVALQDLKALSEEWFRPVFAEGHYDTAQQILLDNQVRQSQPGYLVYTPLRLTEQNQSILVNRGWIPWGKNRQQLPDLPLTNATSGTTIRVTGKLSRPPNPGILLDNPISKKWPKVVQHIDYVALSTHLGYTLAPAVILLDPAAPDGYVRDWQPTFGGLSPQRHIGYAVQWFALAITLLIIYIAMNFERTSKAQQP